MMANDAVLPFAAPEEVAVHAREVLGTMNKNGVMMMVGMMYLIQEK